MYNNRKVEYQGKPNLVNVVIEQPHIIFADGRTH